MKKIMFLVLLNLINFIFAEDFINKTLNEQDDLIENVKSEVIKMSNIINTLEIKNAKSTNKIIYLEKINENISSQIDELSKSNESLKSALKSNKEDTHETINMIGDMIEDVDKLNKQKSKSNKFVQILIPSSTIPITLAGLYLYTCTDEKEFGKFCCLFGGSFLIGAEIIWNGGKIINIW